MAWICLSTLCSFLQLICISQSSELYLQAWLRLPGCSGEQLVQTLVGVLEEPFQGVPGWQPFGCPWRMTSHIQIREGCCSSRKFWSSWLCSSLHLFQGWRSPGITWFKSPWFWDSNEHFSPSSSYIDPSLWWFLGVLRVNLPFYCSNLWAWQS